MEPVKIILDTDIGDDIDDAFALCFGLGSPEFDLLGVTVVYGDVETRARIARRMVRLCGRGDIPVVVGLGRPLAFEWHPGAEPEVCSQRDAIADDMEPLDRSRAAAEFIGDLARQHPGRVHVLTMGAMTNVAAALGADSSLAGALAGVVSLAGYAPPRESRPEWNVRYDPPAAQIVARSGVPWTAIGADVQGDNKLTPPEFAALAEAGQPWTDFLVELIVLMKRNKGAGDESVRNIDDVTVAHVANVMTFASFLIGDRMDLTPGTITVDDVGAISFTPAADGPHRYALRKLGPGTYRRQILRRILNAGRAVT